MRARLLVIATAGCLCSSLVRGQCSNGTISVSVSPSGGLSSCNVTYNPTYLKYDVAVTRNPSTSGNVEITVSTSGTDNLHNVVVTTASANTTWLYVGSQANPFQRWTL